MPRHLDFGVERLFRGYDCSFERTVCDTETEPSHGYRVANCGSLPANAARVLVFSQSNKLAVAKMIIWCPLHELKLPH